MATKDLIIELVNKANNPTVPLDSSVVALSDPIPHDGEHNTSVTVSAIDHSGYTGHVDVRYNRLNVQAMEPVDGFRSEDPFTTESVLALLDPQNGVTLTTEDVEFTVPAMEVGEIAIIDVTAKAGSLGWNGSAKVALLHGLPPNSDDLYNLMNHLLPSS